MKTTYLTITACVLGAACVILALDRVRMTRDFGSIGEKINDKSDLIVRMRKKYDARLELLQREIARLDDSFRFVTELREPLAPLFPYAEKTGDGRKAQDGSPADRLLPPFVQISDNPDVVNAAKSLQNGIKIPYPENVRTAFLAYLLKADRPVQGTLFPDAGLVRVIDRDAAILETLCRNLGLSASTEIRWDMNNLTRSCETRIVSPDPAVPAASVRYGAVPFSRELAAVQSAPVSIVLAFPHFDVPETGEHQVFLKLHEIPVGGLYIHKFDIRRPNTVKNEFCYLEYKLPPPPEGKNGEAPAEPYLLQAFSLSSGPAVVSAVSGRRQTFRIPFANGRCSVIVFGRRVFLPESVTATLSDSLRPFEPEP